MKTVVSTLGEVVALVLFGAMLFAAWINIDQYVYSLL